MKKHFPVILLAFFCILSLNAKSLEKKDLKIVKGDGTELICKVEVAKTEAERNFGFMKRKSIPDGTGMIFIFENDRVLSFWMKDTPHPLSIAYISKSGIIKNIFDMTPFSLASVSSTISVRYALEVPQGWFEKSGIRVGDKVLNIE